jgi:hypothetical protein
MSVNSNFNKFFKLDKLVSIHSFINSKIYWNACGFLQAGATNLMNCISSSFTQWLIVRTMENIRGRALNARRE